jgi:thioester reductase-like protein/predicted lipid carrier protein YhbT
MTRSIFLTGITGSVGSAIARQWLENGARVVALVRGQSKTDAAARVARALSVVGAEAWLDQVTILQGDICQPGLGLTQTVPAGLSCVVHSAARMDFDESQTPALHRTNVQGTGHVLDWAAQQGLPVAYVSTAYIAGQRKGRVYEHELNEGQGFHNPYEATKCEAEALVQTWSKDTGLNVTVFRLGIVVGESQHGRIVHFDGIYTLLRFFDGLRDILATQTLRVIGNPEATKNLVPADYVAKAMWHILAQRRSGTYHLTHPNPVPMCDLRDRVKRVFQVAGACLVPAEAFEKTPPTRLESLYQKAGNYYEPYLREEPLFDRSQTDLALAGTGLIAPDIDDALFDRLVAYAKEANWGRAKPRMQSVAPSNEVQQYFEDFLTHKMHEQLIPDLKRLSASCRIIVQDMADHAWALKIEQGRLEQISRNGLACECSFTVDRETFGEIVSGRLAPQKAFFLRQVEINGDMEIGLKLATVLAQFFKQWPFLGQPT